MRNVRSDKDVSGTAKELYCELGCNCARAVCNLCSVIQRTFSAEN
jgi:hypothetical protein